MVPASKQLLSLSIYHHAFIVSLSVPRVKTNTGTRAFHSCAPFSGKPAPVCPFSHFSSYLQETSEDKSLWLGLFSLDTATPNSLLMPWNCFIDFAIEHWFSCRATEPGFARDIGAIEIWLIDWLIATLHQDTSHQSNIAMGTTLHYILP